MKLGIVGTGMIVRDLLKTLHQVPVASLAIWGRNQAKTRQLADEYGIPLVFNDYAAMLHADVDTVYIALPNHLHFSFAEQALAAGKHVIMEKPITSNSHELQTLRDLAKTRGLILIEAVTVHYLPAYLSMREKIAELGEIKIVSLNYSQYSSRYDRFKAGEVPPVFDPQQSGGALMDLNVYNIHFAVGLFGKPQDCIYAANMQRGIDTSGILLLDYPDFKVVCIGAKDCAAPVQLSIQGDKGNITIPMPANAMHRFILTPNHGIAQSFDFAQEHRMLPEFRQFVKIIDSRDIAYAEKMLDISATVCKIMEKARKRAGIIFAGEG